MIGKKRMISAILAATFSIGAFPTAYAANIVPTLNTTDHTPFMNGMSDGFFYPNKELTRAQLAYILYNVLSERPEYTCTFTDVQQNLWYSNAIGTLEGLGVLDTPTGGQFRPNDPVTRGEAALIISAFLPKTDNPEENNVSSNEDNQSTENTDNTANESTENVENTSENDLETESTENIENASESSITEDTKNVEDNSENSVIVEDTTEDVIEMPFSDVSTDGPVAKAIIEVTNAGLFNGYEDGTFKPDKSMIRSEGATVINKLLKRVPDTTTISTSDQVRFFPDVPKTHWAYNQIMEATVPHTSEPYFSL